MAWNQIHKQCIAAWFDACVYPKGAYAEYIVVPETHLIEKPEHLSWVQAASIPENWLTGKFSGDYMPSPVAYGGIVPSVPGFG